MNRFRAGLLSGGASLVIAFTLRAEEVYPQAEWVSRTPEQAGLSRQKLDDLRELAGGSGCVVRGGLLVFAWGDPSRSLDVASAFKPLLSTLLFIAVQEGRLRSVDDEVSEVEPRLKTLAGGKNSAISWRHLASQTSGYGLAEPPGEAYAYNDFALALYFDTLIDKVFHEPADQVLETRLARPLQFQDAHTFSAFGPKNRQGRLAISVRDFARFGLLYLRRGRWRENQIVRPEFIQIALSSPVSPLMPLANGRDTEMIPRQRSIGGGKNITPVGPGFYSFNWWLNGSNKEGKRLLVDAPEDAFVASGHGGMRTLLVLPSVDLVVCWNESTIDDHDQSPGNPDTRMNRAARLIKEAVQTTPSAD